MEYFDSMVEKENDDRKQYNSEMRGKREQRNDIYRYDGNKDKENHSTVDEKEVIEL